MREVRTKIPNKLNIWSEFNQLCLKFSSVNLSHGRPSVLPPEYLLKHMEDLARIPNIHQYTSLWGHPELQAALSAYYSPRFNRQLKPNSEILVTPGGMAAHFAGIFGLATEKDDEVFSFAPYFPTYLNQTQFSGVKFVTSKLVVDPASRRWAVDFDDLPKKLNKNTRIIMLNSPHNPTGKVFTEEELLKLSAIFDEFAPNAIILNDVVYENVVFDNNKFTRFANINDNWRRTVTIYSAGKMMSCTGWKIGWLIGPSELIRSCAIINESIAFQTNTICQLAVAKSLPLFDNTPSYGYPNYSAYLTDQFTQCRDILFDTFTKSSLGLTPLHAEGGYFLMADATNVRKHIDAKYFTTDAFSEGLEDVEYKRFPGKDQPAYDYVASRYLALKVKVAPMPVSLFYTDESFDEKYLRFAICQTTDTIAEARKRIEAAEEWLKKD